MKKWEYKVQRQLSMDTIGGQLNKLGEMGWELISVGEVMGNPVLYLKRPLKAD